MISDNIRMYRKQRGISQEEMAVRLHVVRQTVSKWEKGLSVPDAEVLLDIANLLDVSVDKLLGVEIRNDNVECLSAELARLNGELAEKNIRENTLKRANEKRGLILMLSFASMVILMIMKHSVLSTVLSIGCILAAVCILYNNMALLTSITTDEMRIKTLQATTIINVIFIILSGAVAVMIAADVIEVSEQGEKIFAMLLIAFIMILAGLVAPKLPFSRHTGLRLPWTVGDKETWDFAHRIVGFVSLPIALLYVACALTIKNFEVVTLLAMVIWIGVPGVLSYLFYWRKLNGKIGPVKKEG